METTFAGSLCSVIIFYSFSNNIFIITVKLKGNALDTMTFSSK